MNYNIACANTKLLSFIIIKYDTLKKKHIPYKIIFKSMYNVSGAQSHSYAVSCFTLIILYFS